MHEKRSVGPADCRETVERALAQMMSRPQATRPFVIIECEGTGAFVQFRGSQTESLLFDVPALEGQYDYGLPSVITPDVYRSAAFVALETLETLRRRRFEELGLGYQPFEFVVITEHTDDHDERDRAN